MPRTTIIKADARTRRLRLFCEQLMLFVTHRAVEEHLPLVSVEPFINRHVFGPMVEEEENWEAIDLLLLLMESETLEKLFRLYEKKLR